jgi:predicted glycosyltransferase
MTERGFGNKQVELRKRSIIKLDTNSNQMQKRSVKKLHFAFCIPKNIFLKILSYYGQVTF